MFNSVWDNLFGVIYGFSVEGYVRLKGFRNNIIIKKREISFGFLY